MRVLGGGGLCGYQEDCRENEGKSSVMITFADTSPYFCIKIEY